VAKELPRWRLAERILTERSLPWSRLTAELERSLVVDVRLKALQRTRGSDQKVQIKVKGEAITREAETAFVEQLQKNPFFGQVILEREAARQGGGIDFDFTLEALQVPPPYQPLPAYGPQPVKPLARIQPGQLDKAQPAQLARPQPAQLARPQPAKLARPQPAQLAGPQPAPPPRRAPQFSARPLKTGGEP
jgi:hypothetical protein